MNTRKPSGKMEKRAAAACAEIVEHGGGEFSAVWCRSNTWGLCPSIRWHGEKAAHASGCGYDKLSAVVAEFLQWLPGGAKWTGAAGIGSTVEAYAKAGWKLEHIYSGKWEDGFRVTKLEGGAA